MLEQLLNYIDKQKLWQPNEKILVGVSGGIDSVVLAHLLSEASIPFAIAHCNFRLRGSDSDEDETFVKNLAKQLGVKIFVRQFDTKQFAERHSISIQMSARELRKAWFEDLKKTEGFDRIATAHHLNDSLETVLFNLTKGTGIAGLKGIPPQQGDYVRPLMFATRQMIKKYAISHGITWREDRSNETVKYHRNLIRHKVIPELKKINPALEATFIHSMEKIIAVANLFTEAVHEKRAVLLEPMRGGYRINKEKLLETHEFQIILYEILKPYGFNYSQTSGLVSAMQGQPGKIFESPGYLLTVDREYLFINPKEEMKNDQKSIGQNMKEITTGRARLTFEKLKREAVTIDADRNTACLDYEKLEFPLVLRPWKKGDFFMPLGMKGKKKVSDFMIDEKIPLNLKNQVMVLQSGKNLVWIVGHRIDDRYKVTDKTRWIYKIRNYLLS